MKKFLSLVLALAMAMSLVVVNTSAKEFTDDADITYDEAVAVISELGIVDGYNDGSFNPTGGLTRGAAAKIICNLILGPTTAAELHADTAPFSDVSINNEFAGYIAYCAKEGIISGYADGAFRPANPLTGYAFMKMLLGALGYDANYEQYVGENWSINVAKQAIGIGLNNSLEGEFNGVDYVNREEACLYAFNTLQSTMVAYENKVSANVNGAEVVISNTNAKPVEWSEGINRDGNIKDDNFVQFAEEYFPKLYLDNTIDVFGRPSRQWEYDGKDIGTYVNHDLLEETYTTKVTGRDLYDLLGKSVIDSYDVYVYVDGETDKDVLGDAFFTDGNLVRTNTETVGKTGNGVTTEVYVDPDNKDVTIAIINTYLAVAVDDYNEKKEEASFTVYKITDDGHSKQYVKAASTEVMDVSNEDINVENIEDEDVVLVTVADGMIQEIMDPEVLSEVSITRFTKTKSITTGGDDYSYADTAMYDDDVLDKYDDQNLKDTSYNVYLDQYGYLVGIEIVEEADRYVFLTGIDGGTSNLSTKNVDASVIFLDGTMDTVKVNTTKSSSSLVDNISAAMNTWCTYTVDKDGVYTLTEVKSNTFDDDKDKVGQAWQGNATDTSDNALSGTAAFTVDKKHVTLHGDGTFTQVYGNDASVYLAVDTKAINATKAPVPDVTNPNHVIIISDVDSVSTGVQSTSMTAFSADKVQDKHTTGNPATAWTTNDDNTSYGIYTLFKNNGYVIAAVVVGEDEGTTTNYAYVISDDVNLESYDSASEEYTWTRDVIINGQVTELTEVGESLTEIGDDDMDQGKWYEVKFFADGTVRRATEITFTAGPAKFINAVSDVEASVSGNFDPVILYANLTATGYTLSTRGNTLQVSNTGGYVTNGFGVAPDAKIVLVQDKYVTGTGKTDIMSYVEEYQNGVKGLESVLNYLNANSAFKGYVGAVFEGGVATSVVIYDKVATKVDTGNGSVSFANVDLSTPSAVKVYYYGGAANKPSTPDALVAIEEALSANYTITAKNFDGSHTYTFTTRNNTTGFNQTFTFNDSTGIQEKFLVKVVLDVTNATTGWTISGGEAYVTASDTISVTVTHNTGFSGSVSGSATTTTGGTASVPASITVTSGSATFNVTLASITKDGTVTVKLT